MASFGNSFSQAFGPAYLQGSRIYSEQVRDAVLEKQRIGEENRRREQQLIDQLNTAGIPVPRGPDGKLNTVAAFGSLGDFNRKQQAIMPYLQTKSREDAQTEVEAKNFGIDPTKLAPGVGVAQEIANRKAAQAAKEKAKAAREGIAQLQGEFPDAFKDINVSGMTDESVLGALPQLQGRAASLRRQTEQEAKDSVLVKNAKTEFRANGGKPDSPEENQFVANRVEFNSLTPDYKNAHLVAEDMQKAGIIPNDRRSFERKRADLARTPSGKGFELSPAETKVFLDDQLLLRNMDNLRGKVAEFEQKYGPGSFSGFVGPIDNKTLGLQMKFDENASPAAKDAYQIGQLYNNLRNQKYKNDSGATVTAQEDERLKAAMGDPSQVNFLTALDGWYKYQANNYANRLKSVQGFILPDSIVNFGAEPTEPVKTKERPPLSSFK